MARVRISKVDEFGNKQIMKPNKEYQFRGKTIYEKPLIRNPYMQQGGFSLEDAYKFLFDDEEETAPVTAPSESELEELKQEQYIAGQKEAAKRYNKELKRIKNQQAAMSIADLPDDFESFISGKRNTTQNNSSNFTTGKNTSIINLSGTSLERGIGAVKYLQEKHGLPKHVAAGIAGNGMMESSFRDDVISGNKTGDNGLSFGLFQWHKGRRDGFFNWAKQNNRNPYDVYTQLDYGVHEAKQRGDLQQVMKAENATQAANIWRDRFEVPAVKDNMRAGYANKLMQYQIGGTYDVDPITLLELKRKGYKYKIV